MAEHDLFETEESALRAAELAQANETLAAPDYRGALGALIAQFRRMVRETRRLILHSDRQERELNVLNAKLRQLAAELDYKATHDPLTGAFNRRAVIERTEILLREGDVALIVIDIDHFKCVNDECGHPAGDAVIVELVARLRAIAPEQAEIGRVGGEEFTVLLPRMDLFAAAALAEQMRQRIESTRFAIPAERRVTASFGVSHAACGQTFRDAYGSADVALYQAKRGGRNAVVCSGQDGAPAKSPA